MPTVDTSARDARFNHRLDIQERRLGRRVMVQARGARRDAHRASAAAGHHELRSARRHQSHAAKHLARARAAVRQLDRLPEARQTLRPYVRSGVARLAPERFRLARVAVHESRTDVKALAKAIARSEHIVNRRIVRLNKYLASHMPRMAGQGRNFYEVGKAYNVDPRFLVAIAMHESYHGRILIGSHNAWGYKPGGRGANFRSFRHGMSVVAWELRTNYMSNRNNPYDYPRTSIYSIGSKWAPGGAWDDPTGLNASWPDGVERYFRQLGGRSYEMTFAEYRRDLRNRSAY